MKTPAQLLTALKMVIRNEGPGYAAMAMGYKIHRRLKNGLVYPLCKKHYQKIIQEALAGSNRIFLWKSSFGWQNILYQRPQHITMALAKAGNTVFYQASWSRDRHIEDLTRIQDGVYLFNADNKTFYRMLINSLSETPCPKYLQVYSTDLDLSLHDVQRFREKGFFWLYEYVDDLAPEIAGSTSLPHQIVEKYEEAMHDSSVPIVVTADRLARDVIAHRGEKNVCYASNGVNPDDFSREKWKGPVKKEFENVLKKGKPIVGYYGALAKWFDYELLRQAALALPEVEFVLIGKNYDGSLNASGITQLENVCFLGDVPYAHLPRYAGCFAVCTIPFEINSITNATSPLKLFEYMALGKPIVTTDMLECRKYKSVFCAKNAQEYIHLIRHVLEPSFAENVAYFDLLAREAAENTWNEKARTILAMLNAYEQDNMHESFNYLLF